MDDLTREFDLLEDLCEVGSERLDCVGVRLGGVDRARRVVMGLVAEGIVELREGARVLTRAQVAGVLWAEESWQSGPGRWVVVPTVIGDRVWEERDELALRRAVCGG